MNPLISIIIPLYNRDDLIAETLDSIISQTYTHWECIVIDDGSTDDSVEVVSAFAKADSRITMASRSDSLPKGANACRNYGFELSSGEYINWFDSDDLMLKTHIAEKVATFEKDELLEVCLCENQNFSVKNDVPVYGVVNEISEDNLLRDFVLRKQFIQTGCALWKRTFLISNFKNETLFDESLSQSQDYDFYARALYHQPRVKVLNKVLFHFRRGNTSISSQFESLKNEHHLSFIRVRRKLIDQYLGNDQIQKALTNVLLASYNTQISKKNKEATQQYEDALEYIKEKLPQSFKRKVHNLIMLGRLIKTVGVGAYALRNRFKL